MRIAANLLKAVAPTAESPVDPATARRIRNAQIENMFRSAPAAIISVLLTSFLLFGVLEFLYGVPNLNAELWIALNILVFLFRIWVANSYWHAAPAARGAPIYARLFVIGTFCSGLLWGAGCFLLLVPANVQAELLIVLILTAITSGTVLATGSYLPAAFAHYIPLGVPVVIWGLQKGDAFHFAFVALTCGYMVVIPYLTWISSRNFATSLRHDIEKLDLIEDLRGQKELAVQASRAKSRFLASASHDLRQPIHAIGMFVGALRERELDRQSARLVDQISSSIDAMDSLFASLLDISRLDAGVVRPSVENFAIGPLIDRVCGDFVIDAEKKGLELTDCQSSAIVRTDPVLLERILRNILSNALRYTDRGRVLVGCRRGERLRIQVLDTGRGIAAADFEKIFEEFYQVGNPERNRERGLGLGLAIVKRISALIECSVEIQSKFGNGTCVTVSVPLGDPCDAMETASIDLTMAAPGHWSIFVIDDEASIREGTATLLESWGHRALVAESGDRMFELAAEFPQRPDLIICDYRLRGEDGIQLMNRLRAEYNCDIPGILITGDTAPDRLVEAQRSGYLIMHKPIASAKLRAAMRLLMATRQAETSAESLASAEG